MQKGSKKVSLASAVKKQIKNILSTTGMEIAHLHPALVTRKYHANFENSVMKALVRKVSSKLKQGYLRWRVRMNIIIIMEFF